MLVFDVRFLAQESIYPGPRLVVETLADIHAYRAAILRLIAGNLLAGRAAYWRTFGIFFEDRFRGELDAPFLHGLFEPPHVTIEEILTRVNFHRDCDSIFLIDEAVDVESVESVEVKAPRLSSSSSSSASPAASSNISARLAITRILSTAFNTPARIAALLSFATGCPQLPPAGLDALRLSIHCVPSTGPLNRLSKSHTCSNTIDFYASVRVGETREAFLESVLSSSGFGFD